MKNPQAYIEDLRFHQRTVRNLMAELTHEMNLHNYAPPEVQEAMNGLTNVLHLLEKGEQRCLSQLNTGK